MATTDPFNSLRDDVFQRFEAIKKEWNTQKSSLASNLIGTYFMSARIKLQDDIEFLKEDLNVLQSTIHIVESNRVKYCQIDDLEVESRREFVSKTIAAISSIAEDLQSKEVLDRIREWECLQRTNRFLTMTDKGREEQYRMMEIIRLQNETLGR